MHNDTHEPGQLGAQPKQATQSSSDSPPKQPIYPEENPLRNIGSSHERMQQRITIMLVGLVALLIILTAAMYATAELTHLKDSDVRDFTNHFAAPLLTLLATALGFYFADRRK